MEKLEGLIGYMEVSDIISNIIKTNYLHTTVNTYYQYDDVDSLLAVGILNKLIYTDNELKPSHMMRGIDMYKSKDKNFDWMRDEGSNDNIAILVNILPSISDIIKMRDLYKYIIIINKDISYNKVLFNTYTEFALSLDKIFLLSHDCASKAVVYLLETYFNYYFEPLQYKVIDELSKVNSTLANRKEGVCFTLAIQKDICIGVYSNKWVLNSLALFEHMDNTRFNTICREGFIIYNYLKSKHNVFRRNAFKVIINGLNIVIFNTNDFSMFGEASDYNADILIVYYKNGRASNVSTIGIIKTKDDTYKDMILNNTKMNIFTLNGKDIIFVASKFGNVLAILNTIFTKQSEENGEH